jgi:hypothetical protein
MTANLPAQATASTFTWVTSNNRNTLLGELYAESINGITLTANALTARLCRSLPSRLNTAPNIALFSGPQSAVVESA